VTPSTSSLDVRRSPAVGEPTIVLSDGKGGTLAKLP
jgi:hypothetical protein